jgi:hypothetical protein
MRGVAIVLPDASSPECKQWRRVTCSKVNYEIKVIDSVAIGSRRCGDVRFEATEVVRTIVVDMWGMIGYGCGG